jgi:hypothetical protein
MSIQVYPQLDNICATYKGCSQPDKDNNLTLFFCTAGAISDESGDVTDISYDYAVEKNISTLKVKVDSRHFSLIKHFLVPGFELRLSLLAKPWAIDGNKGISFQLREIDKFSSLVSH